MFTVSIPTKSKFEYSFVAFPAIVTSVSVAADHDVFQVSTGTLVYWLLKSEITFAAGTVGVGAATVGVLGIILPSL